MTAHILVVDDDDPVSRRDCKAALEQSKHCPIIKSTFREALNHLKQPDQKIDLVMVTLGRSSEDDCSFIRAVGETGLDLPVVVLTKQGAVADVAEAMRAGAFDFIVKPASAERIKASIANALTVVRTGKSRPIRKVRAGSVSFASMISASQSMMRVISLARKASHSNLPVLLEGEAGVGKTLTARAIHSASDRSAKPFVAVNCTALQAKAKDRFANLNELSEEFQLKLKEAEGGTLFLYEIGDLPASLQTKLLDLAHNGAQAMRASSHTTKAYTRIISTSSHDLMEEVRSGRFREDLYYRLSVFPIAISPLRNRKDDIPQLVRMFTEHFSSEQRKGGVLGVNADAMALLSAYDWPGNIRQIENALHRAVTLASAPELTQQDFPQILTQVTGRIVAHNAPRSPALIFSNPKTNEPMNRKPETSVPGGQMQSRANVTSASSSSQPGNGAISSINENGDLRPLAEIEEELIRFALGFYRGQMSQVARKLGIGRSTLYRKLRDYGIDPDDPMRDVA